MKKTEDGEKFRPKYSTASIMLMLLALIGWGLLIGGSLFAGYLASEAITEHRLARFIAMIPGLSVALSGLVVVTLAQVGDAVLDTANNTAELVTLAKQQAKKEAGD